MRRLATLLLLPFVTWLIACSDDSGGTADTTTADTGVAETTPAETDDDTAVEETSEDTTQDTTGDAAVCEHPCLDEFGKNDKSLCPEPQSEWICTAGCCQPVFRCETDADCAELGFVEEHCEDERFACLCNTGSTSGATAAPEDVDPGICFTWLCAVAADCATGEICAGGACVASADAKGLAVRILDRPTVLTPGATYQLHAEAFDPEDDGIVVAADELTWASSDDTIATVDAAGLVTAQDNAGLVTISAENGDESASLTLENVIPAGEDITVIVRTELTWEPVTGRYVTIDRSTGETLAEDLPADGIVRISTTDSDGPWDVHIFADDNDWLSWLGLDAGATIYLPLAKSYYGNIVYDQDGGYTDETILDNVGVIRGTPDYTTYSYEGTLEIVLTTTGLSSALFDFNLSVLLGSDVERYLHPETQIPRVDPTEPIDVPGGIVFNLIGPAIPDYILTAPRGSHRLWSLGGKLNINDVAEYSGVIFDAIAGGDLDFTRIVGAVFPLFRNFWSGYAGDVVVDEVGLDSPVIEFTSRLTTPMGLEIDLDVPQLPAIDDLGYADGVFLISGAQTLDGFLIPLGLQGGADTADKETNPPDGFADFDEKTDEIDPFPIPAAPLHAGLQGPSTRYVIAAVAASIPGRDDPRPSAGAATFFRWGLGERPSAEAALAPFLGFPSYAESGTDFEARVVQVAAAPAGSDLVRVLMKGKRGSHWTFYGVAAESTLDVPDPADFGVEADRFIRGDLESVLVNSLDFSDGVDLSQLGRPGGLALDLLLQLVDRVSFIDLRNQPLNPE